MYIFGLFYLFGSSDINYFGFKSWKSIVMILQSQPTPDIDRVSRVGSEEKLEITFGISLNNRLTTSPTQLVEA